MSAATVTNPAEQPRWYSTSGFAVTLVVLFNFLVHFSTSFRYGPEADEMYYLAASHHMAWGYEDMPPLIAAVMWALRHVCPSVFPVMNIVAAMFAALEAWLTAAIARELGGRRWAQAAAALTVTLAPLICVWAHILTMNLLEQVIWTAIALAVARAVRRGDARMWLVAGVLIGIGFNTKYTIGLLVVGLLAGMLLTRERRWLRSPWLWAGLAAAVLLPLPDFLWQMAHGYTFLHHMRDLRIKTGSSHGIPIVFAIQVFLLNPVTFLLWAPGFLWCFTRRGREARLLGCIAVAGFGILLAIKGRAYYMLPAFPMMFATGAVAWQQWCDGRGRLGTGLKTAYVAVLLAVSLYFAPIMAPVFGEIGYYRYAALAGRVIPAKSRPEAEEKLPKYFQDEFGWEGMVQQVAAAYRALPEAQRADTAVLGEDYSDASAVAYYHEKYGLPEPISGDVAFWYWGPREFSGNSVIVVGSDTQQAGTLWGRCEKVGRQDSHLWIEHYDILLCSQPKHPLREMWPYMQIW